MSFFTYEVLSWVSKQGKKGTWRKEIYPEYKANRKERYAEQTEKEEQEFQEFLAEFQVTMNTLKYKGHLTLKYAGVEADDIAALICQNRENLGIDNIWMISSDKDWDLLIDEHKNIFHETVTTKFYGVVVAILYEWRTVYIHSSHNET